MTDCREATKWFPRSTEAGTRMDGKRFIQTIRLKNILSYGPDTAEIALLPLNVLIGPNASGKSNLIEILSIIAAAPQDIQNPIRLGGGAEEWVWKGQEHLGFRAGNSTLELTIDNPFLRQRKNRRFLKYSISFLSLKQRFIIWDEYVEDAMPSEGKKIIYYAYNKGKPYYSIEYRLGTSGSNYRRNKMEFSSEEIDSQLSILSQRKGINPELTYIADQFGSMKFYRKWDFPKSDPPRQPGRIDSQKNFLLEDASNLSLVLSDLFKKPKVKSQIMRRVKKFYPEVDDIVFDPIGNSLQMFLHERQLRHPVPATRISDGSLHYLCLLAVLCHPTPPPVICFEEPEISLHPDIISELAELLVEASQRSQIIVATHSDILVDALTDVPESIVVCEKQDGITKLHRLSKEEIESWLEDYRLGEIWMAGQIGGTRW